MCGAAPEEAGSQRGRMSTEPKAGGGSLQLRGTGVSEAWGDAANVLPGPHRMKEEIQNFQGTQ